MRLVALVAVLMLAGCATPAEAPAPPADGTASIAPMLLKLAPCDTVRMILTVPTSAARAMSAVAKPWSI